MNKYKRNLKHHTDSSHGWVGVQLAELAELGLTDKITIYSYVGTDCTGVKTVYLEEDCDLCTYLNKLEALNIGYVIEEGSRSESNHWIRSLARYELKSWFYFKY